MHTRTSAEKTMKARKKERKKERKASNKIPSPQNTASIAPPFANLSRHSHSIHLYTRNPFAAWYSPSSSLLLPLRFVSGSHVASV